MKKERRFRCLAEDYNSFKKGLVYKESDRSSGGYPVSRLVESSPREWEEVFDNEEEQVNSPSHYNQGGIGWIDAMFAATVNKPLNEAVLVSNVMKYLWRYEAKNGIEDVKKAQWYINKLVEILDKK